MESVASNLDESTGYFVAHGRLLERLSEAEKDLDRRIADNIEAERRNALSQPLGTAAEVAAGGAIAADSAAETMIAPAFVAQDARASGCRGRQCRGGNARTGNHAVGHGAGF